MFLLSENVLSRPQCPSEEVDEGLEAAVEVVGVAEAGLAAIEVEVIEVLTRALQNRSL